MFRLDVWGKQMNSTGNHGPFDLKMVRLSQNQFRLQLINVSSKEAQSIRFQLFLREEGDKTRRMDLDFADVEVLEAGAKSILQPIDSSRSASSINDLLVRLTRDAAEGKSYQLRLFFEHPDHAHQIIPLGVGSNLSFPQK